MVSGAKPGSVSIVDVNGERAVFTLGYSPTSSTADIAELRAIFDSIQFAP